MNAGTVFVELKLDDSDFDKGLRDAENKAESGGSRIGNALSKLGGFSFGTALAGLAGIGGGLIAAGVAGFGFNKSLEEASAQIQAFTKDSAKTEEILAMVQERAAKTPFEFNAMATAAGALIPTANAAGESLEDLMGISEILAASNPAQGLEGAAFALKEAASGDFASIIERFNLPRQRLNELKEQGVPSIEAVRIAMQELGLDSTLVTNMAETLGGRWSTFKDTLVSTAGIVMKPFFDMVSGGFGNINTLLEANAPLIESVATQFAQGLGTAIQWVADTAIPALIDVWNNLQPTIAAIMPIISSVIASFGSGGSSANTLSNIINMLSATWVALQPVITTVVNTIRVIVTTVFTAVQNFLNQHGDEIASFMRNTWTTIQEIIAIALDLINATVVPMLTSIANFIAAHGNEIQTVISAVWNMITSIINIALAIIKGVLSTALALIKGDWQGAWLAVQTMFSTVWENIKTYLQGAIEFIKTVLKVAWEVITSTMRKAWDGVLTLFKIILAEIRETVSGAISGAISFLEGLAGRWAAAGRSLINSFFDGIKSRIDAVINFVKEKAAEIAALLPGSEPKDMTSPLRGLKHRGEAFVTNFQSGIESAAMNLKPVLASAITPAIATSGITNANNQPVNNFYLNYETRQSAESVVNDVQLLQGMYAV